MLLNVPLVFVFIKFEFLIQQDILSYNLKYQDLTNHIDIRKFGPYKLYMFIKKENKIKNRKHPLYVIVYIKLLFKHTLNVIIYRYENGNGVLKIINKSSKNKNIELVFIIN